MTTPYRKRKITAASLLKERGPHGVERQCIDYLVAEKVPHIRLNRREQAVFKALGFSVQDAGAVDCIAFVPAGRIFLYCDRVRAGVWAVPIWIDWKRPVGAKYSEAQLATQEMCRVNGIPHAFVHSLDELKRLIPPRMESAR